MTEPRVVTTARCLAVGCGWAMTGPWDATDRAAEQHTRKLGHVTTCLTARYPVRVGDAGAS